MVKAAVRTPAASSLAEEAQERPLRVCHLIEALGPGGAERLLYTNLKHLQHMGIQNSVVMVFGRATYWKEPIRRLGIPVTSLDCESSRDLISGIGKLKTWLREHRPDVLHSHLWAANVIGRVAGRLAGVPVISSIHNPDHEPYVWQDGADVKKSKRRIALGLDRWTARFGCARMIAVSNYVKQSAHRHLHYPLERIDLLYNPIDTELLNAAPSKSRSELLRELDLSEDTVILLNVARVSPQKGLVYALRALPAVRKRHPTAHLFSVGATTDPKWLAQINAEAKELGVESRFHILGAQPNVIDFLRSCDVFVFPSLYEGLGIALIEAMGVGCACVATNAGPIPEFIEHEHNGLLVSPESAEELAEAICRLLENPDRRAQLGFAAREVARRFQPERAAETLVTIYRSVVN